jgi:uncharacterized protein (TIGR02186 family)
VRAIVTAALGVGLLCASAGVVHGERLASTMSSSVVQITSSFDGAVLSLFGNILPDRESPLPYAEGPYEVVIVVTGPLQDRVTRMKTNAMGVWASTDEVRFKGFPSFYAVIASGKLGVITTPETLAALEITPEAQARLAAQSPAIKAERFGSELVRLMKKDGHLSVSEGSENGTGFISPTAYTARVVLPSDVVNGAFIARTLVFKNKVLVADHTEGFAVRKSGFEAYVFTAARQQPLLYGLACVLLALGTGWLAGVVFRR